MERKKDIGAFWIKRSAKGGEYISGYIQVDGQKISIVAFPNGYKKEEKHPDYHVYKSEPREVGQQQTQQEPSSAVGGTAGMYPDLDEDSTVF